MSTSASKQKQDVIDRTKIPAPEIIFSPQALSQLALMLENDFTLAGKYLRILISGKGCDGFTYSIGFSDLEQDDLMVALTNDQQEIAEYFGEDEFSILMDPFTAFYLQYGHVDYIQNFETGEEGFKVTNQQQTNFRGKFWKKDSEKVPPLTNGQ